MEQIVTDKTFDKIDYRKNAVDGAEYENCIFTGCDFSGIDLSGIKFIDCLFTACNLSLTKIEGAVLRDVRFKDCKMLGIHFDMCNEFGLSFGFENCTLDDSSFYKRKIKGTCFKGCRMHDVDFTECDLTGAVMQACDLLNATFDETTLEKADLSTSFNYSIDPATNRIKKARFSIPEVTGLLYKHDIRIDKA